MRCSMRAHTHGGNHEIVEDIQRQPVTYNRLIMGSLHPRPPHCRLTSQGQPQVGVLLPNATGTLVTLFGLHAFGRVPAMLNFSTGAVNMAAACSAAQVSTIVTSRRFIEAAEMEEDAEDRLRRTQDHLSRGSARQSLTLGDKLYGLFARFFAKTALRLAGATRDAQRAGGRSSSPRARKACRRASCCRTATSTPTAIRPRRASPSRAQDIVFNALPMFHAFGLTGGTLLPVLAGVRTFFYPSPLHYKVVPELCYDTNATILFGTDTFLMGYARNAHPYDFFNVRLVVAGAERVKPETREIWMEKFGLRILEGYGATECSPVLAVNTPMHFKTGTVGRLLDQIQYRLEPVRRHRPKAAGSS